MFIESVDRIIPQSSMCLSVWTSNCTRLQRDDTELGGECASVHDVGPGEGAGGELAAAKFAGARVAWVYEAGPTGYGVYDALSQAGDVCLVTPPALLPRVPGRRVKTNRLDSLELAIRLRGSELTGLRVPAPRIRSLRHLTHR